MLNKLMKAMEDVREEEVFKWRFVRNFFTQSLTNKQEHSRLILKNGLQGLSKKIIEYRRDPSLVYEKRTMAFRSNLQTNFQHHVPGSYSSSDHFHFFSCLEKYLALFQPARPQKTWS